MDRSLSGEEVLKLSDGGIVIKFSDLERFENVDDLFDEESEGKCIILLESEAYRGHWVCLYRDFRDNSISYFDPYGFSIEQPLKMLESSYLEESNQAFPHLLYMLLDFSGDVYCMDNRLQKLESGINTCGRWCGFYLKVADLISVDDFAKAFKRVSADTNVSTDEIIVSITDEIFSKQESFDD